MGNQQSGFDANGYQRTTTTADEFADVWLAPQVLAFTYDEVTTQATRVGVLTDERGFLPTSGNKNNASRVAF